MPVKITNTNLAKEIETGISKSVMEMAVDIRTRAVILAPVLTGALKNSGVVKSIVDGYRIQFGSSRVPYARRRHFENRKNPQTLGYLAKAADSVSRGNMLKYFRGNV